MLERARVRFIGFTERASDRESPLEGDYGGREWLSGECREFCRRNVDSPIGILRLIASKGVCLGKVVLFVPM